MGTGALGKFYSDRETIVREGDVGDCMFVVQMGRVEVVQATDTGEQHLRFLEAGDFFGEMAVFEKETRSATVRAYGEARVLKVDKRTLLRRIEEDPLLAVSLLQTMSHRIRDVRHRASASPSGAPPSSAPPSSAPPSSRPSGSAPPSSRPPSSGPESAKAALAAFKRITPAFRPAQVEKTAPCQTGCPNCGDIRGWIGTVAQRAKTGLSREEAYTRAWQMITDVNPFPSVLGRVCPHPCEEHCNRSELDEPLAINAMERFLGDWAIDVGLPLRRLGDGPWDEWIGVVGAGPSGLSFAYQMARRGYRVTVYEGKSQAGGMLRYGIPDYRLPPQVLDAEISRILGVGVELELGTRVGSDITFEELRSRHATLYLGIGAQMGRGLGIPGEQGPSVWTGTNYLARVNCAEEVDLGARVVVVGGGNTAIDAARTARRAGAEVTILYRRSRDEMPAIKQEVEDALEEGIELILLAAPLRIERTSDGKLAELVACRTRLGEPDDSGRRSSIPIPDSEMTLPADVVIAAVSQAPILDGFEALHVDGRWLLTDEGGAIGDRVLAGGDALGLGIAGNAIVQGRRAAEELHARLRGQSLSEVKADRRMDGRPPIGADGVMLDWKPATLAAHAPKLTGQERVARGGAEVAGTISEEEFLAEASRCFSCGSCFGCEQCSMFCTPGCFTKLEEVGPGMYFTLALDKCLECGKCVEVCPCGFLEVTQEHVAVSRS
jgi:NADPH-dependent glutamate synthase beta subunit-like oxidoreductase/NAD-dependent dihydropyrimidine dehydrogenase PreA subunit